MATLTVTITAFGHPGISPLPSCSPGHTTPCAPCYVGASTSTLTYPSQVEHVTVEATPYISQYSNGSYSTSWEYLTLLAGQTAVANSSNITSSVSGSHIPSVLTWIADGSTLTYPTTYLEYYDFVGAGPHTTSSNTNAIASDTCAQVTQTRRLFPTGTLYDYTIVPWTSTALPPTTLPPQILSYLDNVPSFTSQLGDIPIESCLPIPTCTVAQTSDYCSTICRPYTTAPYPSSAPNGSLSLSLTAFSAGTGSSVCSTICPVSTFTTTVSLAPESSATEPFTFTTLQSLTTASVLTTVTKDPIVASNPFDTLSSTASSSTTPETLPSVGPAIPSTTPETLSTVGPTIPSIPVEETISSSLPPQSVTVPSVSTSSSGTTCTDALCALTATPSSSTVRPQPTISPSVESTSTTSNVPTVTQSTETGPEGVVITAGSQILTASVVAGGSLVVGSTTVAAGQGVTLSNSEVISAGTSVIVVGGSSVTVSELNGGPSVTSGVVITANGATVTATLASSGVFVAGTTTFTAGQVTTLANGETATVGSASALSPGAPAAATTGVVITANGQTVTATQVSSGVFVAGTITFTAGQVTTVANGETVTIPTASIISGDTEVTGAVFTIDSQVATATEIGPGSFAIGSTTLVAGHQVTLSDGEVLGVNSAGVPQLGTSTLAISTFSSQATPTPDFVIDGQTLTPGGVITDGPTTISLDSAGSTYFVNGSPAPVTSNDIVVGGSTYTAAATQAGATGSYIMCGIQACDTTSTTPPSPSQTAEQPGTNAASRWAGPGTAICGSIAMLVLCLVF